MYQIVNDTSVRHTPSGTVFPVPPVERFGRDYQRWLDAGNTPEPAQQPPKRVTMRVTMRQARLALHAAGLLHLVDAAIDNLEEPHKTAARIEWEYSQEVHRDKPLVAMLAPALGLSESDLDDLFTAAAQL